MVRVWNWKELAGEGGGERLSGLVLVLWGALVSMALIWAVVLACADGASKEKSSAGQTDNYGGTACGAGCGGGCGG